MDEVKVNEYIFKYISGKGKMTDLSIPEIDFESLKSCSNKSFFFLDFLNVLLEFASFP